jgi:hypothetical protein
MIGEVRGPVPQHSQKDPAGEVSQSELMGESKVCNWPRCDLDFSKAVFCRPECLNEAEKSTMSAAKHDVSQGGAWHVGDPYAGNCSGAHATVRDSDGRIVIFVPCEGASHHEVIAIADLAAAAPKMLAALKFVRTEFAQFLNDDRHSRRVRDCIDAAIRKAEGRS